MSRSEATALAELDRLGGSAAAALRDRVEALVPLDEPVPLGQPVPLEQPVPLGQPASLDRPGVPPGRVAKRRRRALAAAAVLVVVAGAAAAVVATRDEGPSVTSGGGPQYLLPGSLPDGLTVVRALRLEEVPEAGTFGGDVVAYGRGDADDPWAGPVLAGFRIVLDPSAFGDETEGETITVAGHPATLTRDEDGWAVEWPVDGDRLMVRGFRLGREHVIAAAQALSADPAIGPAGLPDGFAEIAHGPLDAALPGALGYSESSTGLAVSYGPAADVPQGGGTLLGIIQRPGTAAAVDLARITYPDAEATRVRGQHAVIARPPGDPQVLLQWFEPGGQLVTMLASGLSEDTLRRVADGLRPAETGEIDRLVTENPPDLDDDGATATDVGAGGGARQGVVTEGESGSAGS